MKKLKLLYGLICALTLAGLVAELWQVKAQSPPAKNLSTVSGVYDAVVYSTWRSTIAVGFTGTGSQTMTVCPGIVSLPDGRQFQPFASANGTFSPITVDSQVAALSEVVTPTATSLVAAPTGYASQVPCASVTASFTNAHNTAASGANNVSSGDLGIQEAINDASLNGGGAVHWTIDPGIVTLNTGGQTTTAST